MWSMTSTLTGAFFRCEIETQLLANRVKHVVSGMLVSAPGLFGANPRQTL